MESFATKIEKREFAELTGQLKQKFGASIIFLAALKATTRTLSLLESLPENRDTPGSIKMVEPHFTEFRKRADNVRNIMIDLFRLESGQACEQPVGTDAVKILLKLAETRKDLYALYGRWCQLCCISIFSC
ncbi:MAG: hypothetical protein MUC28_03755 [Planctomycetes bacterium]|jgi:hypothetical protein|nr:hypothetical protein [Planctomycetota bacterium]